MLSLLNIFVFVKGQIIWAKPPLKSQMKSSVKKWTQDLNEQLLASPSVEIKKNIVKKIKAGCYYYFISFIIFSSNSLL